MSVFSNIKHGASSWTILVIVFLLSISTIGLSTSRKATRTNSDNHICGDCRQKKSQNPNVILIMADDMGYSDMGATGGEIHTPNIDKLANQGTMVTRFYNMSRCRPTRAALLSGLYPVQTNYLKKSDNNVPLPEVFDQAGYETIIAGKWHLGNWSATNESDGTPLNRGFDHFFGFLGGAINYFTGNAYFSGENLMRIDKKKYNAPDDFYSTDYFTDYSIEQITEATQKDKPFFLYLAYNAPHFPLQVPREEIGQYRQTYNRGWDNLRNQRYKKMKQAGIIDSGWRLTERDPLVPPWSSISRSQKKEEALLMATYAGMVDRMDQGIGKVMDRLKKLGIKDNTIVMFLSDNGACPYDFNRTPNRSPGPSSSNRTYNTEWANVSTVPFHGYKRYAHEGGSSTPLIVRWPGQIPQGKMTRVPGHVIDIMPTLLDMADLESPKTYDGNQILPMEGKSIFAALQGNSGFRRGKFFWEYKGARAVIDGKWKLVGEGGRKWELYNMKKDRTEITNLISEYPSKVTQMISEYNQWAHRVGARDSKECIEKPPHQQERRPLFLQ